MVSFFSSSNPLLKRLRLSSKRNRRRRRDGAQNQNQSNSSNFSSSHHQHYSSSSSTNTSAFRGGGGYGGGGGGGGMTRGLSLGSLGLGAVLGAGVGAGLSAWWLDQRTDLSIETTTTTRTRSEGTSTDDPLSHPALKYGMPVGSVLRSFTNFVSYFDTRTRNPQWVIEKISEDTSYGDGNRKFSYFKEDASIPEKLRNKLEDFRGSGYDRGHMAPASAHKLSQKTMDETFTLSNISPQVGAGFNRDYWARFESYVKGLCKEYEEVLVVTGPLFLPRPKSNDTGAAEEWEMRYNLLGQAPDLMAVPTHFFKVVLTTKPKSGGKKSHAVGSFVMPNAHIPPEVPLTSFVVPLDSLERATGTIFFPKLISSGGGSRANVFDNYVYDFDKAAVKWQGKGVRDVKELESVSEMAGSSGGDGALVVASETLSHKDNLAVAPSSSSGSRSHNHVAVKEKPKPPVRVKHVQHLCDATACELPKENFWKR